MEECPCVTADRFVVASETATPDWLRRADVLVARERRTCRLACQVSATWCRRLPGCALVVVPAADGAVVLDGSAGFAVVASACAICLYPWVAGGGRVTDLPDWLTGQPFSAS